MKTKAKPYFKGDRVIFSVVLPTGVFDALDNAPSPLTWRQLAQQAIRDYAATLPQKETPATTEVAGT